MNDEQQRGRSKPQFWACLEGRPGYRDLSLPADEEEAVERLIELEEWLGQSLLLLKVDPGHPEDGDPRFIVERWKDRSQIGPEYEDQEDAFEAWLRFMEGVGSDEWAIVRMVDQA